MNVEYNNAKIEKISVNNIIPNRFQPRKNFDVDLLNELADSIRQYGIVQPLVLRKLGDKYEIIAGERRYKAACMIGLSSVPAIVMELDDTSSAEIALIENVQRKDLTAIEEAKSYKQILGLGQIKQEELGKKIGKTQSTISNKLRLLNLSEEAQQALLDSKISERHARSLLRLKDKNIQNETLNKIIESRMTVRETDKYIKDLIDNHKAEEQTEEILDFSDDNDKKGDNNMNQNSEKPIFDNFNTNIPDYDQININNNNQQPAFINEEIVNNAKIDEPSRFFNYDNQSANMNFDSTFTQNPNTIINDNESQNYNVNNFDYTKTNENINNDYLNHQQNMINNISNYSNFQSNDINPNNSVPIEQNQIYNNYEQQNLNQNYNNPNNFNNFNDQQNIINQQTFQNNGEFINQFQNDNMINNYQYNQPVEQQFNQPIETYQTNDMYVNNQNNIHTLDINRQDYNIQQQYGNNDIINSQYTNNESHTMMMQQDITGAVVVIRNTIMNLQSNGYGIEINEQDLGNLYQIVINLKK